MHQHARRHESAKDDRQRELIPAAGSPVARSASAPELAAFLRGADTGARTRLAGELHARHGNAAVASLLDGQRMPRMRRGFASSLLSDLATTFGEMGEMFGGGEETEAEEALPTPTKSGTTINVSNTTYDVTGTFADVAATLEARSEAGSVTSHVSDIYYEPMAKPIKIAAITVDETVSLPNWVGRAKGSQAEIAEWDRFRSALSSHEQQHVALDKVAFAGIHKKCVGKSPTEADAAVDAASASADTANDQFDADTKNGRTQGTIITIP